MDTKPFSPACERNRDPILAVLRRHFLDCRSVLEVGSGTGQHAVHFAGGLPWLSWQCADLAPQLPGIRQWLDEADLPNTPPPLALDVCGQWPEGPYEAVFSANILHIVGWTEVGVLRGGRASARRSGNARCVRTFQREWDLHEHQQPRL